MAIEHLENWSAYGLGGQARLTDGIYSEKSGGIELVADPDPTATGNVLQLGLFGKLSYVLNTPALTLGWAERIFLPNLTFVNAGFMRFYDAGLNLLVNLAVLPTGQIKVFGPGGAVLGTSSLAQKITANGWNHVEARVVFAVGGAGSVEIRVNGVVALLLNAVTTTTAGPTPCSIIQFACDDGSGYSETVNFKDVAIWNTAGTHNVGFMGAVQVVTLIPDSDADLEWTPNTGSTGYNRINFAPPTDDASYIAAPTVGEIAQFTLSDLPPNVTAVKGCQLYVRAKKADGGDGNIQAAIVHGVSEADGADRPITTAYTYFTDVFEVDPATGGNISPAAMNEMQVKVTRTV